MSHLPNELTVKTVDLKEHRASDTVQMQNIYRVKDNGVSSEEGKKIRQSKFDLFYTKEKERERTLFRASLLTRNSEISARRRKSIGLSDGKKWRKRRRDWGVGEKEARLLTVRRWRPGPV